jgi:ribosomal protein L44E
VSSRTARATQRNPVLKNKTKQNKTKQKKQTDRISINQGCDKCKRSKGKYLQYHASLEGCSLKPQETGTH